MTSPMAGVLEPPASADTTGDRAASSVFAVSLDVFEGPFDLLLSLISKHKLDITEVALSKVTDEFIAHVKAGGKEWDLEQTSSFLLVAATLLDLKAARLLPQGDVEDEEDLALLEARDLLFARLLQYRAFKLVAGAFAERLSEESRRHPREVGLEERFAGLLPEVLIGIGLEQFAGLAAKAADVYKKSAGAAAAVALGGAAPVAGSTSVACPGGGSVAYSGPATGMTATYNACVLGVHTFAGSATVSYVASGSTVQSYVIDYSNGGVNVSAPNGFGATLTGRTSCDSSSGTRLCVADYQNVRWGNDFEYDYAGNLANGSTACDCTASQIVLVQAANLAATSGVANVTGASGSAVVTRTSATAFTVNLTAGGVTVSYPVTVTSP